MCGIIGILLHDPLATQTVQAGAELAEGLSLLQHRGQDAAGVVTCGSGGRFYQVKANGMVRDVFDSQAITGLKGYMGVGHVRYPTAGGSDHAEAQPFYVNSPYGITFAHNGNLINTPALRQYLDADAHRHINTNSDSECLLNILADNLQKTGKFRINEEDIFKAIGDLMSTVKGAYACVAMLAGFGLIAFRDPNGIRPVGIATRKGARGGVDYLIASESVVAQGLSFDGWDDVKAGEAVIITRDGGLSRRIVAEPKPFAPDIFEHVYFARPDSTIDGISVYRSRMAMGELLAENVERELEKANLKVDVVIPVPDTSRVAALQLAQHLGLPYREGFVKNRYIGRTFIMPGQSERRKNVRRKLNAMPMEFAGKTVLLVDDSIVRGTTSKEIIQMARDVGAKKVIIASCAPPIRHSNVYGIDMPSPHELVAYGRTTEEIAEYIGADLVIYQTLDDLVKSCSMFNPAIKQFDCSVFTGDYITGGVDEHYLEYVERLRNDKAKAKKGGLKLDLESQPNGKSSANGPDGVVGLVNHSPKLGPTGMASPNDTVGLHNSIHGH
ncbi:Amidophosphoribosyltransferase [Vanrija pseudolonga]|uniref:Amidophosphoribosyltransferase n=1 Tax=Vanrija pseudolonga TaxID=143232 RepID=A0AAF0YFE3_9TREE|nr:Amidophosphoribosyltransferase [Vanrija pseudolonga]